MTETITKQILDELQSVKNKLTEMDAELHSLRDDFQDSHMNENERIIFVKTLEDESKRATIPMAEMKRRLGY